MNFFEYIKKPITGNDILNIVERSVIENEQILTQIQKDQWNKGEDKESKTIGYYKPSTEFISKKSPYPNKPKKMGKPYNLDWTGDLKRSTHVSTRRIINDVLIQIDSTSKNLLPLFETIEKYGSISNPNTIFGYKPKNLDVVTRVINKDTLKKLKNKYNGM